MMVPKKSLFLAGVAVLFTSFASAQAQVDQKTSFRRYTGPLTNVHLDLETGTITRGPVVQNRAVITCDTFQNIDLGGFVGADTGSCACEWYDAATKAGGKSSYVSGLVFAYCSSATDPISGGPGGSASLFFNEGYTLGANGPGQGPNGTDVARILLTGLPANTACSSFFGGFRCFFITVGFNQTFCLADGNIGYGWKFVDMGTPGVLAKTFPFLSCVTSCTGPGPDGQGMVDMTDQYCPPGFLLSTFSFGTTAFGGYFTSVSMDVREAQSNGPIPNAVFPGVPANTPTLVDSDLNPGNGPNIGDPSNGYRLTLDCSSANGAGAWVIQIRPGLAAGGNGINTGFGRLIGAGPTLQKFSGVHAAGPVNTPGPAAGLTLPKTLNFACLAYTNQGFCGNSSAGQSLSQALRETIGIP